LAPDEHQLRFYGQVLIAHLAPVLIESITTRPNWAKQLLAKGLRANTKLRKAKAKRVTTSERKETLLFC